MLYGWLVSENKNFTIYEHGGHPCHMTWVGTGVVVPSTEELI